MYGKCTKNASGSYFMSRRERNLEWTAPSLRDIMHADYIVT